MSSKWEDYGVEELVLGVLHGIPGNRPHHFGGPFLTAYQVAIAVVARRPGIVEELGKEIGGAGTGEPTSLAQYLANQLSRRIADGTLPQVEGAFVSCWQMQELRYNAGDKEIRSSVTGSSEPLSMFRLRAAP